MKRKICFIAITSICGLGIIISSCRKDDIKEERITIYEEAEIQHRITYDDEDSIIGITEDGKMLKDDIAWELKYKGKVKSPKFDNESLQATHIAIVDDYAYVSYNYQGEPHIGAYDIVDISDPDKAKLVTSVVFSDTDVSTVYYDEIEKKVYLATARDSDEPNQNSVIEIMEVDGAEVSTETDLIVVPGYAATDAKTKDDKIFALSGNNAGMNIYNQATLGLISYFPIEDARAVEFSNNYIIVMQGTPARLQYYNRSDLTLIESFTYDGANTIEAKSSFYIYNDEYILMGAGDKGVIITNLETGGITDQIALPDTLGSHEGVESNSVAVENNIIFIANGEAGTSLAEFHPEDGTATWLGRTNFQAKESANFVVAKNDWIFIARGAGGFHILQMRER